MSEESSQDVPKVPKEKSGQPGINAVAPRCPVPPEHVQLFEDCCNKYEKGEMSDIDVMETVITTLKKLKKE